MKPTLVSENRSIYRSTYPALTKIDRDGSNGDHSVHYKHLETPELNANGKAFNGNRGALIVAGVMAFGMLVGGIIEAFKAAF